MRLLDVDTLEIKSFPGRYVPPYAILSHTWGDEEAVYDDFIKGLHVAQSKAGYDKVRRACTIAKRESIQYIWIDTCCINKESSAELSEAINSMFRYYQDAEICYAYLEDVSASEVDLIRSRWFTRGFTLQELVAPSRVSFFSGSWALLGDRSSLSGLISTATRIDADMLRSLDQAVETSRQQELLRTSVACRMSWAANRETTRPEDIAYCLLGIFNVNMPLLYGEGETNAFYRLQEQIFKQYNDQSILAWTPRHRHQRLRGWLAEHPREFGNAANVVPLFCREDYTVSERGLHIHLSLIRPDSTHEHERVVLDCHTSGSLIGPMALEVMSLSNYLTDESNSHKAASIYMRCRSSPQPIDLLAGSIKREGKFVFIPKDPSSYRGLPSRGLNFVRLKAVDVDLDGLLLLPANVWNHDEKTVRVKDLTSMPVCPDLTITLHVPSYSYERPACRSCFTLYVNCRKGSLRLALRYGCATTLKWESFGLWRSGLGVSASRDLFLDFTNHASQKYCRVKVQVDIVEVMDFKVADITVSVEKGST